MKDGKTKTGSGPGTSYGPYRCKTCGKFLDTKQGLGGHMSTHKAGTGEALTLGRVRKAESLIREANAELRRLRAKNEALSKELEETRRKLETEQMAKAMERMEDAEDQLKRNLEVERQVKNPRRKFFKRGEDRDKGA